MHYRGGLSRESLETGQSEGGKNDVIRSAGQAVRSSFSATRWNLRRLTLGAVVGFLRVRGCVRDRTRE